MSPTGRATRASTRGSTNRSLELSRSRPSPRGRGRGSKATNTPTRTSRGQGQQLRIDTSLNLKPAKRGRPNVSSRGAKKSEEDLDIIELGRGFEIRLDSSQSNCGSTTSSPKSSVSVRSAAKSQTDLRIRNAATGLTKEEEEEILKDFDLNCLYGACRGISRKERYERAILYKINPTPREIVGKILEAHQGDLRYESCLWDQNTLLRYEV